MWMWRNTGMRDFVEWLRDDNTGRSQQTQAGLYGFDRYSLLSSTPQALAYLDQVAPEAARRARSRYLLKPA